jgi:hypothetical protein
MLETVSSYTVSRVTVHDRFSGFDPETRMFGVVVRFAIGSLRGSTSAASGLLGKLGP